MKKQWPYLVRLMLDSGVFSAAGRDQTLDLKKYIQFIKDNEKYLWSYVNMDVIPSKFGARGTQTQQKTVDQAIASASEGYKNLQTMKDAGLRPIHVFHQGESYKWLERLLHDGEDYIGISSAKDLWAGQQRQWLDTVFSIITDSKGKPYIRTHGFGITNPGLLFRYPWYTTDSTTWSLTPGYGQVLIPPLKPDHKTLDYSSQPMRVVISGLNHKAPGNQKRQFQGFAAFKVIKEDSKIKMKTSYEDACKVFLQECGISVSEARYGTTIRRRMVLLYYLKMVEHLHQRGPCHFKQQSNSFTNPGIKLPTGLHSHDWRLNVMFATTLSKEWSDVMTDVGANTRLLSYYELMNKSPETLMNYVTTGAVSEYEPQMPKYRWDSETYRNYRRMRLLERYDYEQEGMEDVKG